MALATADEIRVVALENFKTAMLEWVQNDLDFEQRKQILAKIAELEEA